MKFYIASASAVALTMGAPALAQSADLPPAADPGECFARVLVPETVDVVVETIEVEPERTEVIIVPAQYDTVTETVVTKEAETVLRVVPARYETVTEEVVVEPSKTVLVPVPEQTETFTEQVMVRDGYTTWKPGVGLFGRGAAGTAGAGGEVATGELLCMVQVPPEFRTVTRTRVVQAATTREDIIPAVTRTVSRQVLVEPPRTVEEVIPATTSTVQVERLVSPAREDIRIIPAVTREVERRVVTGGGGLEWREVLCETNTTPAKIAEIQRALTAAGYSTGGADGSFGAQTLRAMEAFQRDNGLPVGNLTVSTAQALGVSPF